MREAGSGGRVQDVEWHVEAGGEGPDAGGVGEPGDEDAVGTGLAVGLQAPQRLRDVAVARPVGVRAGVDEQAGGGRADRGDLRGVPADGPETVLQVDPDGADGRQLPRELPTSSGSSLNPSSASTESGKGAEPRTRASRSVSSRVADAPSGSPAAAATPRLVVPTARKPCPARAKAEAWSQAHGSSRGSPARCSAAKAVAVTTGRPPRRRSTRTPRGARPVRESSSPRPASGRAARR